MNQIRAFARSPANGVLLRNSSRKHCVGRFSFNGRWLEFLASCIAECDRAHSPEEVAAAAAFLDMPKRPTQPQLELQGRAA